MRAPFSMMTVAAQRMLFAALATASLSVATPALAQMTSDSAAGRPPLARLGGPRVDPGIPPPASGQLAGTGGVVDGMSRCMNAWDAETHMSKPEWRETCQRVERERAAGHVE